MKSFDRLADNIRCLRTAYGETQAKLAEVIHYSENMISYFENGGRVPDRTTISAIAKHYMISDEELTHSDFSDIGRITINEKAMWENIDVVYPIVMSESAMKNEHFKRAHSVQIKIYERLRQLDLEGAFEIDIVTCVEEYDRFLAECTDDEDKAAAVANNIAFYYLLLSTLKLGLWAIQNRPAALGQIASKERKVQDVVEAGDAELEKDMEEALNELDLPEYRKEISEDITIIKKSRSWADLADYYLALQYFMGLTDNELGLLHNRRIGIEMLNAFVSVENTYAARFLKLCEDAVSGVNNM